MLSSKNTVCKHWPVQTKLHSYLNKLKIELKLTSFNIMLLPSLVPVSVSLGCCLKLLVPELTLRPLLGPDSILPVNRPQ